MRHCSTRQGVAGSIVNRSGPGVQGEGLQSLACWDGVSNPAGTCMFVLCCTGKTKEQTRTIERKKEVRKKYKEQRKEMRKKILRWGHWNFSSDVILLFAFSCPGVDTACNRHEYQGISFGGKGDRCVRLIILPFSYADCLKILGASTSWNPRGLPTPVQGELYLYICLLMFSYQHRHIWYSNVTVIYSQKYEKV